MVFSFIFMFSAIIHFAYKAYDTKALRRLKKSIVCLDVRNNIKSVDGKINLLIF